MTDRFVVEWEGLQLVGTIHLPHADGPHPAVLMMQGSGASDRDSNGYFPEIRQAFLNVGVATYAFDKPGCGESTGDWRDYALVGRASQAIRALDGMGEHRAIDSARLGVWGQSQGGWMAQMLASRVDGLAFAIANSGPTLTIEEQDIYGCRHTMQAQGFGESDIESALAFIADVRDAVGRDVGYEQFVTDVVSRVIDEPWYTASILEDEQDWKFARVFAHETYDPRAALRGVNCPFLAIYGGHDVLLPAYECARESGQALTEAPTTDSSVVVFPDGDHRLHNGQDGPLVEGYLDLLTDWTARRITGPA